MSDDSGADPAGDEGSVLSPNELDISDDESVVEIDDGRYVISPGGDPPRVSTGEDESDGNDTDPSDGDDAHARDDVIDLDTIHEWLDAYLSNADAKYAFDVTASFEGRSAQKALFSNDVVTTFENLVVWYAHHAGGDTPVEDVIGILLTESNVTARYPPESIRTFAGVHGLGTDDSIEDFIDAVEESGGITFPPEDQ